MTKTRPDARVRKDGVLMVRGCEKRIIHLKNPQSELFEEAIFLLKENPYTPQMSDIVAEANRILGEGEERRRRSVMPGGKGKMLFFFLGFGVCALLAFLLLLIF